MAIAIVLDPFKFYEIFVLGLFFHISNLIDLIYRIILFCNFLISHTVYYFFQILIFHPHIFFAGMANWIFADVLLFYFFVAEFLVLFTFCTSKFLIRTVF